MSTYDVEDTYNTAMTPRDPSPEESKKVDYSCEYVKIKLMEPMDLKFWRAIFTEALGSGLFLLSVVTTVMGNVGTPAALSTISLSFGLTIFALVYSFSPISGAKFNTILTFALMLKGQVTVLRAAFEMVAQVAGAIAGVAIARGINVDAFNAVNGATNQLFAPSLGGACLGEIFFSFFFTYVVLCACDKYDAKHIPIMASLSIGITLTLCHYAMIPVDNASINPARSIATSVVHGTWSDDFTVLFVVSPLSGAFIATVVHELTRWRSGLDN